MFCFFAVRRARGSRLSSLRSYGASLLLRKPRFARLPRGAQSLRPLGTCLFASLRRLRRTSGKKSLLLPARPPASHRKFQAFALSPSPSSEACAFACLPRLPPSLLGSAPLGTSGSRLGCSGPPPRYAPAGSPRLAPSVSPCKGSIPICYDVKHLKICRRKRSARSRFHAVQPFSELLKRHLCGYTPVFLGIRKAKRKRFIIKRIIFYCERI